MLDSYARFLRASRDCTRRATKHLAGALAHDAWRARPFPPYFASAHGAFKKDVDGRKYVDLWMGHGSQLLGHGDHRVVAALATQLNAGIHVGGMHEKMLRWAELICELVPSVDQVRFTSSGNEATSLACRIARAYTKRSLVIKLDGHFHGWHDLALAHFVNSRSEGIAAHEERDVVVVPPLGNSRLIERILKKGKAAAVILEPGGGSNGALPFAPEALRELRSLTARYGTLLIFDEVVSGFRYALGGAQALARVSPDITVMAKIAAGGMPGGIVGGRRRVMRAFAPATSAGIGRVTHAGTFNGNPLTSAAAIATLNEVTRGKHIEQAAATARQIAKEVNVVASEADVDVSLFASSSIIHMVFGFARHGLPARPSVEAISLPIKYRKQHETLRCALLLSGIDMHLCRGWVSSAHRKPEIIEAVVQSFRQAFHLAKNTKSFRADL